MKRYLYYFFIGLLGFAIPVFAQFSDELLSIDLAPNPQSGYVLSTDGTNNTWIVSTGGGGGSETLWAFNTGSNYVYSDSASTTATTSARSYFFTATSTADASTFPYASSTSLTSSGNAWLNLASSTAFTSTRLFGTNLLMTGSSTIGGGTGAAGLTVNGTATATSLVVPALTSALTLTDGQGLFAEYAGTSCTNQMLTGLSVLGAGTCETIDLTDTNITAGDALTITANDIDFDGGATPGGSLGGTWASPTIDDLFLLNNGDVGTGNYDFGGASFFEIPNGTGPTADDPGEIAHDTSNEGQLIVDDFVIRTKEELFKFAIGSTSPSFATNTVKYLPVSEDGYVVTDIFCFTEGGTNKPITLFGETITCDGDGATDDGSIAIATIGAASTTAGGGVTPGAGSGAVNYVNITISGRWTRE